MGKTEDGAIWLDNEFLSSYDYWQFWRNTEDTDVGRFLRLFTELSLDEIARLEILQDAEINEAKKILWLYPYHLRSKNDAIQISFHKNHKLIAFDHLVDFQQHGLYE